jgi:hypothetical protein
MAARPVVGALALGIGWGGVMAVWAELATGAVVAVPIFLAGGLLGFGPVMAWAVRRRVHRWDAAHPAG